MTFTTFELVTNLLLAPSEHRHLVRRTLRKRKQIAATVWALPSDISSHSSGLLRMAETTQWPYFMSRASLARTSSLSSQNSRVPFTVELVRPASCE